MGAHEASVACMMWIRNRLWGHPVSDGKRETESGCLEFFPSHKTESHGKILTMTLRSVMTWQILKNPSGYYVKCRCRGKHRSRGISEKACELIQTRKGSEKWSDSKRQQDLMPGYMWGKTKSVQYGSEVFGWAVTCCLLRWQRLRKDQMVEVIRNLFLAMLNEICLLDTQVKMSVKSSR